jgi:lipopolysaccharide/colanic/teichoic acid biosynthesis glycosyltransferase
LRVTQVLFGKRLLVFLMSLLNVGLDGYSGKELTSLDGDNLTVAQSVQPNRASGCLLAWRQRQLIVHVPSPHQSALSFSFDRPGWLVDCLRRSPIELVKLDLNLEEEDLRCWANACAESGKLAFLRLRSDASLPHKTHAWAWKFKRVFDWLAALFLLIVLSPVLVGLALLIILDSPGSIFYQQWRVGKRGKLFKIIKFRTMVVGADRLHHQLISHQEELYKLKDDPRCTTLGRWLNKYNLDELPQLINILRGEMSLVGPRPCALDDAVRIKPELQLRLNALPGMIGTWQVKSRSHLADLTAVNRSDLKYLHTWSIWQDLKFLLMTLPRVFSDFGAY